MNPNIPTAENVRAIKKAYRRITLDQDNGITPKFCDYYQKIAETVKLGEQLREKQKEGTDVLFPDKLPSNENWKSNSVTIGAQAQLQAQYQTVRVSVTMYQAWTGCTVPINVTYQANNGKIDSETVYCEIPIGCDDGEVIYISKKQRPDNEDNLRIIVDLVPFDARIGLERKGLDILHIASIKLKDALCGTTFRVSWPFAFDELRETKFVNVSLNPGAALFGSCEKVFPKMGFSRGKYIGAFIVRINVVMPEQQLLTAEVVDQLRKIPF